MFERFTERARRAVVYAQDESRGLKHGYIGVEHLLLGLLREGDGVAAAVLGMLGVTLDGVRAEVVARVGEGGEPVQSGQIPFTPQAKKVLEFSLREAVSLGYNHIGTEHILLGLTREKESVAAEILRGLGADAETVRSEVARMLSVPGHAPERVVGRVPRSRPFPPISADLQQALAAALGAIEVAKKTAKQDNDTRRMAVIVHVERLLERLLDAAPPDETGFPGSSV